MRNSSIKGGNVSMGQLYMSNMSMSFVVTSGIGLLDKLKVASACEKFESTLHWEKDDGDLSICSDTTKSKSKGKKKSCCCQPCECSMQSPTMMAS